MGQVISDIGNFKVVHVVVTSLGLFFQVLYASLTQNLFMLNKIQTGLVLSSEGQAHTVIFSFYYDQTRSFPSA